MREKYIVEGYLINKYSKERISKDFSYETTATSFEEAEKNAVFKIKTERLKLAKYYPAELKQIEGKHFTYRDHRDV